MKLKSGKGFGILKELKELDQESWNDMNSPKLKIGGLRHLHHLGKEEYQITRATGTPRLGTGNQGPVRGEDLGFKCKCGSWCQGGGRHSYPSRECGAEREGNQAQNFGRGWTSPKGDPEQAVCEVERRKLWERAILWKTRWFVSQEQLIGQMQREGGGLRNSLEDWVGNGIAAGWREHRR